MIRGGFFGSCVSCDFKNGQLPLYGLSLETSFSEPRWTGGEEEEEEEEEEESIAAQTDWKSRLQNPRIGGRLRRFRGSAEPESCVACTLPFAYLVDIVDERRKAGCLGWLVIMLIRMRTASYR